MKVSNEFTIYSKNKNNTCGDYTLLAVFPFKFPNKTTILQLKFYDIINSFREIFDIQLFQQGSILKPNQSINTVEKSVLNQYNGKIYPLYLGF